jgi:hypothetical protein
MAAFHTDPAYDYNGYSLVVIRDKPNGKVLNVQIFLGGDFVGLASDENDAMAKVDDLINKQGHKGGQGMSP